MEVRDLTYFLAVAGKGHIGRAAQELGLTQPALTKSIARLERQLNARLFERTAKGVTITQFGQHVLRHASRVSTVMDDAQREFTDLRTGHAGHLRIGTGLAMAQHMLPIACAKLLASAPSVTILVTGGTSSELDEALRNGQFDLVLSAVSVNPEPRLVKEVLMEDHVVVIARKGHPLQRQRVVTPRDLSGQRWVLSKSGSLLTDRFRQHFQEAALSPPVPAVQTESIGTLLGIVAASDLLTFASWSTIRHSPLHGVLRPLAGSKLVWRRELGVKYREGGYLSSAARRLVDLLKAVAAEETGLR